MTAAPTLRPKGPATPIDVLMSRWLTAYGATHSEETRAEYERMTGTYFEPAFRTLHRMTDATLAEYMRARLRQVSASTVKKELSALRSFVAWCMEQGHLSTAPHVPSVPRRATGTKASNQLRVDLTPHQVEALLGHLSEYGIRYGYPIRDVITLMWDTSLRIATIQRLESPRHFRTGRVMLLVTADIDKSRYERELPVNDRAREILERHAKKSGLIFGPHSLRAAFRNASLAIGLPDELARRVGPHDLRHAAITHMASSDGGNLAGISYLAGHKTPSMTARYVHAAHDAASRMLAARTAIVPPGVPRARKKPRKR